MFDVQISEAKKENIIDILTVGKDAWLDTYVNEQFDITKEDIEIHRSINAETIQKQSKYFELNTSKCFIAKVDDKIVGYAWPRVENNKNEVGAIYILTKYQRQGIGKKLMEKVFEYFHNEDIYVECAMYNTKAIEFYKKNGFEITNNKENKFHELKTGKKIPLIEMKRDRSTPLD
ncbi:MAG: GNAT family N-acetyltransferase [bacterium]